MELKQYKVGDFTFQLDSDDVKRLRESGVEVKAVAKPNKARAPRNQSATPENKGA